MLLPVYPLFAPRQGALDGLGADPVDPIANLQFGASEEFAGVLAGQQAGHRHQIGVGLVLEQLEDALGFGLLFRGQVHDETPARFFTCQFKPPPE